MISCSSELPRRPYVPPPWVLWPAFSLPSKVAVFRARSAGHHVSRLWNIRAAFIPIRFGFSRQSIAIAAGWCAPVDICAFCANMSASALRLA
jgi:hypothetical protein